MCRLSNDYCLCGHPKRLHEGAEFTEWCMGVFPGDYPNCKCMKYRLDNLRYLEAEITRREQKQNDDCN